MEKKIAWMLVSCLMALSLVMASCAPAAVEEEEKVTEEKPVLKEEVVAPTVEKPKYGGVLKIGWGREIEAFDEVVGRSSQDATMHTTNEELWTGDWTKGPAGGYGTNETNWAINVVFEELETGCIAESWELPTKMEGETAIMTFHIRRGVHWALNPKSEASRLVGGRELTADDVIFSLNMYITDKRAYLYQSSPELRVAKITSPAPWTVKIEVPWEAYASAVSRFTDLAKIVPPEVVAKYGTMMDWKVSVGSGPFMLTDYVSGSTATLVRNPNYWMKDPIGPGKGNQLPYLDGVKFFIIRDLSSRFAALRTAKVDQIGSYGAENVVQYEDAMMLKKITPQLMSAKVALALNYPLYFKIKVAPFNDIRVRRALMMATDFETINKDYFGGEAQILTFPTDYAPEYADAYLGLDDPEMPASVKELYTYNPEKAKQLLAEAGYPQGFKTNAVTENLVSFIDYYSIIKDMWSKVGVDLELRPMEGGALESMRANKNFDQMIVTGGQGVRRIYEMAHLQGASRDNVSEINDPVINEAFAKIQSVAPLEPAEAARLYKEMLKHVLDQAYAVPMVSVHGYAVWWPWLKNYSGELDVGFRNHYFQYVWIDQEMKKSMGY